MQKIAIAFSILLLLSGCDEIIENKTTNPVPIGYESNATDTTGIDLLDKNLTQYIPIKSKITDNPNTYEKCSDTPESETMGMAAVLNDAQDFPIHIHQQHQAEQHPIQNRVELFHRLAEFHVLRMNIRPLNFRLFQFPNHIYLQHDALISLKHS